MWVLAQRKATGVHRSEQEDDDLMHLENVLKGATLKNKVVCVKRI